VVVPKICMGEVPWWHAARRPDATAVVHGGGALSWLQLARNASRRAHSLKAFGVRHNDVVTIALPNGNTFFEVLYAVWMAGATPNPVASNLSAAELAAILDLAQPAAVIAEDASRFAGWPVLPAAWSHRSERTEPLQEPPADRWKVMASGGSTGRAKLIVDLNAALTDPTVNGLFEFECYQGRLGRPNGVMLNPGPLHHNGPFAFSFANMFAGSKLVGLERFDAERFLREIEHHRVELAYLVPTMMHRIWNLPAKTRDQFDLSSLTAVVHVGAPCPPWLKSAWIDWLGPERVWESYGATEAVAYTLIGGSDWLRKPGSVGKFQHGGKCLVLDPDGDTLPCGQVGEIWLSLRSEPEPPYAYIGASRRTRNGFDSVGDLGSLDEEGFLYIADRRTDLILRGGVNVYPAEIEAAIDAHPDVEASVVIGLPDPDLGARVHAIVELSRGRTQLTADSLKEFLRHRLASYKLPATIEFVDRPLRNDAGKSRRAALREERLQTRDGDSAD
jgi:bile acid-coenzyme A ligase